MRLALTLGLIGSMPFWALLFLGRWWQAGIWLMLLNVAILLLAYIRYK